MRKWASPLRRRSTRRWRSKSPEGIGATGFLAHDRVSDDPPDRSRLTWSDDLLGRGRVRPRVRGIEAEPRQGDSGVSASFPQPCPSASGGAGHLPTSLGVYRPRWVVTDLVGCLPSVVGFPICDGLSGDLDALLLSQYFHKPSQVPIFK